MDFVYRAYKDTHTTALTLGVTTVVLTHTAMVLDLLPEPWSEATKKNHAYLNLAAAGAIVWGSRWLM
jgi:hypothetical protein